MFSLSAASADDRSNSSVEGYDDSAYDEHGDYEISEPCFMSSHGVELVTLYIYAIICILGLIGNCLVILTLASYKYSKSIIDTYLLNVAVADLLFAAALPAIMYNEAWDWTMGPLACKLLRGAYSVNLYSGTLLLACISNEHYITFVQARRSVRSPFYKWVNCCVVWLLALALSSPTFYFHDTYQPSDETTEYDASVGSGETTEYNASASLHPKAGYACGFRYATVVVPGVQMAVGVFLPLTIVVFCYSAVTVTLLRTKSLQRLKVVWVFLAVAAVFVACHVPYNIFLLVDAHTAFSVQSCGFVNAVQAAETVTKTLAYLHCCLNPMLYAWFRARSQGICCVGSIVESN